MTSNFAQARHYLEKALERLDGDDAVSLQSREALDLLIEAVAIAECSRPKQSADILQFVKRKQ